MLNEKSCIEAITELGVVAQKVRKELTASIIEALERHGGNIDFTDAVDEGYMSGVYVTYDGGKGDPCYDSCEFNYVYAVELGEHGSIVAETECDTNYNFSKFDVHDIINIWFGISDFEKYLELKTE